MSKFFSFLLISSIGLVTSISGQGQVTWVTWEEALQLSKTEKKKIVVDVYTEWCTWCKKMDAATFQKPNIADYINEHYYAIKFDAEQKADIIFNNKIYKFVSGGFGKRGHHELAKEIMNGRLSYPTVVFIDENLEVIQPIPGFQDAHTFEMIMTYFADNHYTTMPWPKYTKNYNNTDALAPVLSNPKSYQPVVRPVKGN